MAISNKTAFLLLSYGAPETRGDLLPFLQNVTGGRISGERLREAVTHYERLEDETGVLSPLPADCRRLLVSLKTELAAVIPSDNFFFATLFWKPTLVDAITQMSQRGIERCVVFITTVFDTPSNRGRYISAIDGACKTVRENVNAKLNVPIFDILPPLYDKKLYWKSAAECLIEMFTQIQSALDYDPIIESTQTLIMFSVHSLPLHEADKSGYLDQLKSTCGNIMRYTVPNDYIETDFVHPIYSPTDWRVIYQSRGGRPTEKWLETDLPNELKTIRDTGCYHRIIFVPLGFFCENMEIAYDLDRIASEHCHTLGMSCDRVKTVSTSKTILRLVREMAESVVS
ncbi:MAG: ferrochelatase [Planctomycetaceae bacterium]|jgi:ferrochelatase|nr:ferrochelatase [Planctomycetaceae bacterium]